MGDGEERVLTEADVVGGKEYTLTITWDVVTDEIKVQWLDVPPWAALGLLRYVESLVSRRDAEVARRRLVEAAPRIRGAGGPL